MRDIKLWLRNRNADYDGRPNIYGHALAEIERLEAELARKDAALRALVAHAEASECSHEDTIRGGAIWTICQACGQKWADDEGGFKPYQEPEAITLARAALSPAQPTEASDKEAGHG